MPDLARLRDRYRGALLGLAAGDALGTSVEFMRPGSFEPLTDMVGGGPFELRPGAWTDDTSMALCLAESLVECRGFDAQDQMERYVRWWREGYLSSTGECFDIGNRTREALRGFVRSGDPWQGSTPHRNGPNGSLMRLAPAPLAFARDPDKAITMAALSSRTTHAAPVVVDCCRYLAALLLGALLGESKVALLDGVYGDSQGWWQREPLADEVREIAAGSFKHREPPQIQGIGTATNALEASLWAFDRGADYRAGALLAVNLGDDADTTGAIYGQLAGAFYGATGIPSAWRKKLALRARIERLADGVMGVAGWEGAHAL
jgi:ADP-ribosyl-[dinitrogen reductase] hydrolase